MGLGRAFKGVVKSVSSIGKSIFKIPKKIGKEVVRPLKRYLDEWKRDRDRYYDEKIAQYQQVSNKYKLGLKWEEYQPIAWEYATQRAKSEQNTIQRAFSSGNVFKTLLVITLAVVGVSLSYMTFGTSFAITSAIISSLLSFSSYAYNLQLNAKMQWLSINAKSTASKINALKAANSAKEQKEMISDILIFQPYAMFANGSIYNDGLAGSESYSPSIAYDPSKGILGTYKKHPIDDFVLNRDSKIQAGGSGFITNILNPAIPLAKFELPHQSQQEILMDNMKQANKRITEGFLKLNELHFNILGTAGNVYNRIKKVQVDKYWKKMLSDDFLQKNKNYSLGLRADFNFLHKKHFLKEPNKKHI